MTIEAHELAKSVEIDRGDSGPEFRSSTWVVSGTDNEVDVTNEMLNKTTPTYQGQVQQLTRRPFRLKLVGYQLWHVGVEYHPPQDGGGDGGGGDQQALSFKIGWDTTGETTKITLSKGVVSYGAIDGVPDNYPAIGWDGKKVNGVETPVAALKLYVDVWYHPNQIGPSIVQFWAANTPVMNDASWLGFAAGELLYTGNAGEETFAITSRGRQLTLVPARYSFLASQNITSAFAIAPGLVVPGKLGWDYLDVFYGEQVVFGPTGGTTTVPIPLRFKVHRMFGFQSFRNLTGIG